MHRTCSFIFLIGFGLRLAFAISSQLQAFHNAVAEAREELQSVRTTFEVDNEEVLRQRRHTINELLANFQIDVNMAGKVERPNEDWDHEMPAKTCKRRDCGGHGKVENTKEKKKTNLNKDLNEKYRGVNNRPKEFSTHDFNSKNEMATKDNMAPNEKIDDFNDASMSYNNIDTVKRDLDFMNELTKLDEKKNDLSHEANYKLSKIEQEAAEKKKDSNWSRKNSNVEKRSSLFNPMNEIKLKTSRRLMRKGFGPSLPSYSLIDSRREIMIDDMLRRREGQPDNKEHKFDDFEKLDELLSVDGGNEGQTRYRNNRMKRLTADAIDEKCSNGSRKVNEYTEEKPQSNGVVAKKQRNYANVSEEDESKAYSAEKNFTEAMNRKKRAASSEDYAFPLNDDFDTVELNEDEILGIRKRTKRSVVNAEKDSDYKRFTSMADEANDNNADSPTDSSSLATRGGRVIGEDDYDDISAHKKRIPSKDFDFGNTARSFGQEEFDNLKQTGPELSTFDGMKFNNLWYDNTNNDVNLRMPNLRAGGNTNVASNKPSNKSTKRGSDTPPVKVEADKNMILALRDEILNSTAYSKLEHFLKLYSPNTTSAATENVLPSLNGSSTYGSNFAISTEKTPLPSGDKKDDMMKLNITINASVSGDQKKNNFVGNGTINVQNCGEERERRGIASSKSDVAEKKKYASKERNQSCENIKLHSGNEMFPLDNMITGKLSSQVVKSMFGLVRTNSKLKVLWPSLKNNRPATKQQLKNFYAIRNLENESEMHRTELMLQKAMETINENIDQQVRSRTCVPLRPDLVDFYEMILQTYAEQDVNRSKRESSQSLVSDFSKEVHTIDPHQIEDKSRIVKKLLKQYEELPLEDQQEVNAIRDDLLADLVYLRKLKSNQNMQKQLVKLNEDDSEFIKKLEPQYTADYMKLLKTSELFRESAGD